LQVFLEISTESHTDLCVNSPFCLILTKIEICGQTLVKFTSVRLYDNEFSGHKIVASGWTTGGAKYMLELIGAIWQPSIIKYTRNENVGWSLQIIRVQNWQYFVH
jgi:hypothetical protein